MSDGHITKLIFNRKLSVGLHKNAVINKELYEV